MAIKSEKKRRKEIDLSRSRTWDLLTRKPSGPNSILFFRVPKALHLYLTTYKLMRPIKWSLTKGLRK